MNRLNTAGTLRIHPRTLDYRFRRVRALVGMAPGSLQGVRVLSAVVARVLAGRWS
jgi:sugar diacid utilization regulator